MDNPPEGMTSGDIRRMSEDDLLDMDYFLHENDVFADETGIEGFYLFYPRLIFMPRQEFI